MPRTYCIWSWVGGAALGCAVVLLLVAGTGWLHPISSFITHNRWHLSVPVFGIAVGASELVGRYKDAPFLTLWTPSAAFYVAVNGLAALVAYDLILEFQWFADVAHRQWIQALVAGFGSMAFFRSSLFTIKVGETDVAVGPGIFFQVLLFATDRACDRRRAWRRSSLVTTIMQGISFEQACETLPAFCFELMQNLPSSEAVRVRQAVDGLASSDTMTDAEKAFNLGLMLMNVVGSDVLASAVRQLGVRIQGPAEIDFDVFKKLQDVAFEKAFPVLAEVCFVMSKYGTPDEQGSKKKAMLAEIEALKNRLGLDNETKVVMLALSLQQMVGDAVLDAALTQLGNSIKIPKPKTTPTTDTAPPTPPTAPPQVDPTAVAPERPSGGPGQAESPPAEAPEP